MFLSVVGHKGSRAQIVTAGHLAIDREHESPITEPARPRRRIRVAYYIERAERPRARARRSKSAFSPYSTGVLARFINLADRVKTLFYSGDWRRVTRGMSRSLLK